jgi:hypothetical protein
VDAETALRRTTRGVAERFEVLMAERGAEGAPLTEDEVRLVLEGVRDRS